MQGIVPGARHLREGRTCQDAVHGGSRNAVVAVAVADGHGTSARGDVGAAIAVGVAIDQLLRFADALGPGRTPEEILAFGMHPLRIHLVREWVGRVRRHAGSDAVDLQRYGSTLLFAMASPEWLLMGQLGDGDLLFVDGSGRVHRPIPSDPASFADETASLCQEEAWAALRLRTRRPPEGEALLILATDGYGKSYASDSDFERIGPDYLDLFRDSGPSGVHDRLPGFLETVSARGSGDDIAVGMLYWSPVGLEPLQEPEQDGGTSCGRS
ncbi:protein phosphatase 2C domain-containing protein [Myxococcota bacterium]|nr:protein phosphatase 2C domain-containing protein [Myxococcota bacterium]